MKKLISLFIIVFLFMGQAFSLDKTHSYEGHSDFVSYELADFIPLDIVKSGTMSGGSITWILASNDYMYDYILAIKLDYRQTLFLYSQLVTLKINNILITINFKINHGEKNHYFLC